MDDLAARTLMDIVENQVNQNRDAIAGEFLRSCKEADSADEAYISMIVKSIEISTYMSVKNILDLLIAFKIVSPVDEKQIRKSILSIVKE